MESFGSTGKEKIGSAGGLWLGLETLEVDPITKGAEGWALYNELWSKFRWTLGTAFGLPYGKSSAWTGDLSRRLTLVVLANRPETNRRLI